MRLAWLLLAGMLVLPSDALWAVTFATDPLFLASTEPRAMLVLSRDHELSKKAYTDYTDLDDDGTLDTTYNDAVDYYGYFDPMKCYTYGSGRFEASVAATGTNLHHCSGAWSGNFLNWATMTRLDVVRKVLYGGFRSTDGTGTAVGTTILERAYLPMDVHAFAKVFAPAGGATEVALYTPYSAASVTLCNVTDVGAAVQAGSISTENGTTTSVPPLVKVASGSWPQWAMAEILQCQWREDFSAELGGVYTRPTKATHRLTGTSDLTARVAVCKPNLLEDNCKSYYTRATPPVETVKPTGLLQQYGDVDETKRVRFGLITGSYKKNTSGGVLRKNIRLLANNSNTSLASTSICGDNNANDEIDVCTGQFINQADGDTGIIDTLNRIHISGYKTPASGAITSIQVCASGYDNSSPFACNSGSGSGGLFAPTDGTCIDWGNPLSEMYHEALRYFAGKTSASAAYSNMSAEDSDATAVIDGLGNATWDSSSDPLPSTEWCALSNIIVLSTGLSSLDNATITSDISGLNPATLTNAVGTAEGYTTSSNILIGSNGTTSNNLCSAKQLVNGLSGAMGICPEVPHMKGGYLIAGLASANRSLDLRPGYATNRASRWTGINADWVARQPLGTYTVGLAENLPSFEITVGSGTVTLVPSCRSGGSTICSMTDLRVESSSATAGSFLISWEDNSAGSDYDMDIIERLEFCVGTACLPNIASNEIKITASVAQSATGSSMELGYTVSGTSADGTVFPIKIPGTATCNPTDCGSSSANRNFVSLLTSPPAYRCTDFNTATPTSSYQCPGTTIKMPSGLVAYTGCPSCPSGVTCTNWGANCGCPKSGVYVKSTPAATLLKNPLWYAAKYGAPAASWDLKDNMTGLETADANADGVPDGDGEPDNFFHARNPANLYNALAEVFDRAAQTDSAAASVATNSTSLNSKTYVYQAKFSSVDWSGEFLAFRIDSATNGIMANCGTGSDDPRVCWDAGLRLNSKAAADRVILTRGASDGVAFEWGSLTTGQQAALNTSYLGVADNCGSERLAYLRGDATNEGEVGNFTCASSSTIARFRPRATKLGDIVNSNPWYVGAPAAGLVDASNPGYSAFRTRYKDRKPMIYVGANNGMLHGFDASINSDGSPATSGGTELIAYVPTQVYPNMSALSARNYNKNHRYLVDGSPFSADVFLNLTALGSTDADKWRTVLVGGLNSGGKGYYALDITNPSDTSKTAPVFSTSNAAPLVLWEFTDANDSDMGHSHNLPPLTQFTGQAKQIVKMANGKWAVVVGNGYNSSAGKAALFVLFLQEGVDGWASADYSKIVADAGPNNGLATAVPFDVDGDGKAEVIYAGDLKGNLWEFDVSDPDPANWGVANAGLALFQARDASSNAQPFTTPPEAVLHEDGGVLVLIGTGKYLESNDVSDTHVQTFYGIWDNNWSPTADPPILPIQRSALLQQTLTDTGSLRTGSQNSYTDTNPADYYPDQKGWYIDLPVSKERTTGVPKVRNGILFFDTIIPSTSACESGGTSYQNAVDVATGGQLSFKVYDTSGDGAITDADTAVIGIKSKMAVGGATYISPAGDGLGISLINDTTGGLNTRLFSAGGGTRGRITWREIVE